MRIIIDYESSWRNSFLDGDNNGPLPQKRRKYIGSMTSLRKPENFKKRQVTLDTVMGLLNRLVGDQRKLYQSRAGEDYFFGDIDYPETEKVLFEDRSVETAEMTFIRNITGSEDQNSFTGSIKISDPMFQSDYSEEFWGILSLDFESLCQFIISAEEEVQTTIEMDPISIMSKLEALNKDKAVENEGLAGRALESLNQYFPDIEYLNNKAAIMPISLYCSALYIQLDRLEKRGLDMTSAKTKAGGISGISKRGFTAKDFMNRFTTGDKKKIWGNPYIRKERVKGVGEITSLMTKASGQLEINLDIQRDKAQEIKGMIERAGVSSFYLGKKGLAFVSHEIDTRELK